VVDRIIKASSPVEGVVLDPFDGSGTTSVVARRNGRSAVGFDTRADYLDIAISRITAEQALF
jgi:DNA modification methylase